MATKKRLIDAYAFIKECDSYIVNPPFTHPATPWHRGITLAAETALLMPTVDAAEVVHAHWEDGCAIHNGKEVYKSIDCSHCNEIFKTEDREYWKKRFKVCPFCGAIMDGERRTNEPEEPV